ncbi:type II toxin-antitoxin system RelE/ParE family toxin [Siphonobacter sp. SORGH_AS_1065]|uniref:type II toxin-antitoxin system RelE/ParE family toxin n=1 Tax=Siphonobacter sp. SORGH_AS_1065 TaxID=3041795 RepID=UPI00277F04E9|nr:type II toxin-antitoxin system RelE/ParE family toxin [Siphonobacter sp. SORGH_AS_1065]MDQ1086772.1 proteic killer suppression protein [Siphonobacter sp. SORGH_AS_1065]
MDIKFRDTLLADLYTGKSVADKRFKSNKRLIEKYVKTVNKLKYATRIEDLFRLNSLNYEKLIGDRAGFSSVRIDDKYRLIFEEVADPETQQVILLFLEEISNHYS